tara:strand:- start:259 stop:375 length:117 start_codon:yes stop_codon:yes gene_type:complete
MDVENKYATAVSNEKPLMDTVHRQARLGTTGTISAIRD